jgi:hypothetical protein
MLTEEDSPDQKEYVFGSDELDFDVAERYACLETHRWNVARDIVTVSIVLQADKSHAVSFVVDLEIHSGRGRTAPYLFDKLCNLHAFFVGERRDGNTLAC